MIKFDGVAVMKVKFSDLTVMTDKASPRVDRQAAMMTLHFNNAQFTQSQT